MNVDDRIRAALRPIREAAAPEPPALVPLPEPRAPRPWAFLIVAASAAAALAVAFLPSPRRDLPALPHPVERRMAAVEERITKLEDPELQALLRREIELLRAELAQRP